MSEDPQPNNPAPEDALPFGAVFWAMLLLTGILTGIAAGLLMKLLRAVQHASFFYHTGTFLDGVLGTSPAHRVLILLAAGLGGGPAIWAIHHAFGSEGGLVSSIWFRSGRLPAIRTFLSGAFSIVMVGMGVSLGRESAPKEYGAAIASKFCQWAKLTRAQRRVLAACGAGAGMGAVYNVPFGGALFGIEVLLGRVDMVLVLPALATSVIATSVSWIFLPMEPTYKIPAYPVTLQQIIWAIVAAPLMRLAAALYIRIISWAGLNKPKGAALAFLPAVAFTALGFASIRFPQLLGNGKDVVQLAFDDRVNISLLAALLILKPLATAFCLRTGTPGGLFTPTMTTGALMGGLLGKLWSVFWPGAAAGSYALIGAGAVLAAATQGPISAIALMLDLTRRLDPIMIPLMLAVAVSTAVARMLESRSIYSGRIPIHLPPTAKSEHVGALGLEAENTISAAAPYATVLQRLFPLPADGVLHVIDYSGKRAGKISRSRVATSAAEFGDPREIATAFDLAEPEKRA